MNHLPIESLNRFAATWFETMTAVAWQSALVILAATLFCQLLRHRSPAVRSWIWRIVAAKLLLMPFYSFTFELPQQASAPVAVIAATPSVQANVESQINPPTAPIAPSSVTSVQIPIATRTTISWPAWLMIAWATVVLVQAGRILWQWKSLRQLLLSLVANREGLVELVEELSKKTGLTKPPTVLTVAEDVSPFVCYPRQPLLVLPRSLTEEIDLKRLRQIVLHELAHIRRGDLWWCWLALSVRIVYWFNPLVHWTAYQANLERELACDAAAIQAANTTAADYAQTLVSAASRSVPLPALQAAVNQLIGATDETRVKPSAACGRNQRILATD